MHAYNRTLAWLRQYVPGSDFDTVVKTLAYSPSYALGDGRCIAVDESYSKRLHQPFPLNQTRSIASTKDPSAPERVYGFHPYKLAIGVVNTCPWGTHRALIAGSNFRHAYDNGYEWATDCEGFYHGALVLHRERVFRTREDALADFERVVWCLETLTKGQVLALRSGLTDHPDWTVEANIRSNPALWYVKERE